MLCCFFSESRLRKDCTKKPYVNLGPTPNASCGYARPGLASESCVNAIGAPELPAFSLRHSPLAAPDTPEAQCRPSTRPAFGSGHDSPGNERSDSQGSQRSSSSGSSVIRDSNARRPQPVAELPDLVLANALGPDARQQQGRSMEANEGLTAATTEFGPSQWHSSGVGALRSRTTDQSQSSGDVSKLGTPIIGPPQVTRGLSGSDIGWDPLEDHPNFKTLYSLSPGASSTVLCCLDRRDQNMVAVKLVSRGVSNAKAAEREVANLRLCGLHPYIVHLREVFLTRANLAIVFDYAPGGNLASYIETYRSSKPGRGISEERTRWIFRQIVVAIEFCHKMGIVNRDIKLENVLLIPCSIDPTKPPDVKLSDFGFSKDELADSLCKTACGTPESVAPEILSGELYDGKSSDIWSLGVLFFAMLTGTFPFSRPSDDELESTAALRKLFLRIAKAQYPKPHHVSKSGLDLLDSMLQVEPEDRIDIAGILRHPWFGTSLQDLGVSVNQGLLDMPDSMLTGFARQTEEEIAHIIQESARRESQHPHVQ